MGISSHKATYDSKYYVDGLAFKGFPLTIGFDFAAPITPKFNLGFYFSIGYEFKINRYFYEEWNNGFEGGIPIVFGPLFMFNLKKGSIYTGFGVHAEPYIGGFGEYNVGPNFRVGYKTKSGLYLFYQFAIADEDYHFDDVKGTYHTFQSHTFHIGFNFLNKKGKSAVPETK